MLVKQHYFHLILNATIAKHAVVHFDAILTEGYPHQMRDFFLKISSDE